MSDMAILIQAASADGVFLRSYLADRRRSLLTQASAWQRQKELAEEQRRSLLAEVASITHWLEAASAPERA